MGGKGGSMVFLKNGLPFIAFMVLASFGMGQLLEPKLRESERRKTYREPEKAEDVLKRMQAELQHKEFEIVPVPGSIKPQDMKHMNKEQLLKELSNLRESEVWTGIPMKKQKQAVKQALRALPRGS
mmetsp:Transcript_13048/g.31995  ORF Transcript_13048/g.31995 Transcript_13048/m.31995 type:complete len:126 (-) Transcript_13048:238-615(-)